MNTTKPISDKFDAIVDFLPITPERPSNIYCIFKLTYSVTDSGCELTAPEPLTHDIRDESLEPRLASCSDYWIKKDKTDLVVQGSAFAPTGHKTTESEISVRFRNFLKRIKIFGDRAITWNKNNIPQIAAPEAFEKIAATYENAYGGLDWRVTDPTMSADKFLVLTTSDHPGMYPRNPHGKGYFVERGEIPDVFMPNLEDPDDLLTSERLIVKDAKNWYLQPLPWCFDWVHLGTFPQYLFSFPGVDAWYPIPEGVESKEAKRGYLGDRPIRYISDAPPGLEYYQGSSLGMRFREVVENEKITIYGMRPGGEPLVVSLPFTNPKMSFSVEDKLYDVKPRLHTILIRPTEKILTMTFAGGPIATHRVFIPGIHKDIPITAYLNQWAVKYNAPETFKNKMATLKK